MAIYQKCIPNHYYDSVYDIDYNALLKQGIKTLFFDLDNTLISYNEVILGEKVTKLLGELTNDFKIVIISNSGKNRVGNALNKTKYPFVFHAFKPLKSGLKKALKKYFNQKDEVILIGDQLMTDIYGANRFKIKSILVKPILKRSDIFTTRINRKIEKIMIKKIKKHYPDIYHERIKPYES